MPLTSVVDDLNDRLHQLHPTSRLSTQAGFRYRQGKLTAGVTGFRLIPDQVPIVRASDGTRVGYSAQLAVASARGHRLHTEALYTQAWDAEDVIFLDRFLRTFHALHHLNLGHTDDVWLTLNVHLRHVSALPEQHGQVFQELLHRLGLAPRQVVLRLSGRALLRDRHVQLAAKRFAAHGYHLVAQHLTSEATDWSHLKALGVQWVTPSISVQGAAEDWTVLRRWVDQAISHGLGV